MTARSNAHVELKNVSKTFGAFAAIRDLSVAIERGSFVALLGPSGCGKSTLLRMIAGLEDVSAGSICIDGQDVTDVDPAKRQIAMVFQSYALYPHMTVRQNISFSLSIAGRPKPEIARKSLEVAQMLQLHELLDHKPSQLSGGQRQRVAIGRALVRQPEVFLFDEPLSNLDALLRVQMRIEIGKLHRQLGATMIYVTHDQVEAMTLADRIVVLDKGVISQIGTPLDLYNHPANRFVASFIGAPAMNFLPAELHRNANGVATRLPDGTQIELPSLKAARNGIGEKIEIGIRPEHIRLKPPDANGVHICGTVQLVERLGNTSTVYLETPNGPLAVQCDGGLEINPGDNTGIALDLARLHLFGSDGLAVR